MQLQQQELVVGEAQDFNLHSQVELVELEVVVQVELEPVVLQVL